MENRKNKPRVFLSHSKADIDFIRRIHEDLRKCQIEPWIDEEDIRHGRPWLDSIFEDGIPTCDSVIVYFTEEALQSQMVKKEIDASIITQLSDKKVAFLPYVSSVSVREKLRPDIRALQAQEWNENNYSNVLPKVVAEVWRSFMERSIHIAIQEEQNKRLKIELELQKTKQERAETVFSPAEQADFDYIWQTLNREIPLVVTKKRKREKNSNLPEEENEERYHFQVSLVSVVGELITMNRAEYNPNVIPGYILKQFTKKLSIVPDSKIIYTVEELEVPRDELLTYGLIQATYDPPAQSSSVRSFLPSLGGQYRYPYTEKMYRFRYWLAFNKKLLDGIIMNPASIE